MRNFKRHSEQWKRLNSERCTLSIDPSNPQKAIDDMVRVVDAKLSRYRSNPIVASFIEGSKDEFRKAILERVEEERKRQQ